MLDRREWEGLGPKAVEDEEMPVFEEGAKAFVLDPERAEAEGPVDDRRLEEVLIELRRPSLGRLGGGFSNILKPSVPAPVSV